jgi:hypothetical protein
METVKAPLQLPRSGFSSTLRILSEMPRKHGLAQPKFISESIQLNEAALPCDRPGYGFCKRRFLSRKKLSIRKYKQREGQGKK